MSRDNFSDIMKGQHSHDGCDVLDQIIDRDKNALIEAVRELVRIRSVQSKPGPGAPFGAGPAQALNKALEIANDLGFRIANLDGYIGYAEYGSGDEYVAVLGHLDVVPEGEGWVHPPNSAEIQDGRVHGRGTTDDKGPIMAALFALKAVRDSGLKISRRVRIVFGTNEESDNADIPYYLERETVPISGFTPDAFYPVVYAEKGILNFDLVRYIRDSQQDSLGDGLRLRSLWGGEAPNMVPSAAEALVETEDPGSLIAECQEFTTKTGFKLTATNSSGQVLLKSEGIAAHASIPEAGKNAIMQLLTFLGTKRLMSQDIEVAIHFLNQMVDMETNGKSFGLAMEDPSSGKLSLNLGMVRLIGDRFTSSLDLRYPVTKKAEDLRSILEKKIDGVFKLENLSNQNPLYYPPDSSLVITLLNVFRQQTGQKAEPIAIGGGTYAKEMPNILAFGPIFPGKPIVEHKPNEYIEISDLILNSKIYAHAIYELSR